MPSEDRVLAREWLADPRMSRDWVVFGLPVGCRKRAADLLNRIFDGNKYDLSIRHVQIYRQRAWKGGSIFRFQTRVQPNGREPEECEQHPDIDVQDILVEWSRRCYGVSRRDKTRKPAHTGWRIRPFRTSQVYDRLANSSLRERLLGDKRQQQSSYKHDMVTFNMNKRKNTVLEFQAYVQKKRPMVLALQEHGCTAGEFQIHVPGYHTISIAREEGRQSRGGLCTLVHNGLVSRELASIGGCDTHPCFLPVRLLDVFGNHRSCIFINVYVPGYKSSHEDLVDRKELFFCLCRWLVRCSQRFPQDAVVLTGDFNMDAKSAAKTMVETLRDLRATMANVEMQSVCTQWVEDLAVLDNKLGITRMGNHRTSGTSRVRRAATCIDHFVVNRVARRVLARIAETDLTLSISDHFPVVAECWTRDPHLKKMSHDRPLRESIIHDNRWAVLAQSDDHDLVKEFPKTTHGVLASKGCIRVRGEPTGRKQDSVCLSRETTRAIREVNSLTRTVVDRYRRLGRYDGYQRDISTLHDLKKRKDALLKRDTERKWSREYRV